MDVERFKNIIKYNQSHRIEMEGRLNAFYAQTGMERDQDFLNVMQIVRPFFDDMGYIVLELPFRNSEIGAFCYKAEGRGYVVMNSSLSKGNERFALCHELYHVFLGGEGFVTGVRPSAKEYLEDGVECAANQFAGMVLMPGARFISMFKKFSGGKDELVLLANLTCYFQVPFMAALIRCYELGLMDDGDVLSRLVATDADELKSVFAGEWLDESVFLASRQDDFPRLEAFIKILIMEFVRDGFISAGSASLAWSNLHSLYKKIKGDVGLG